MNDLVARLRKGDAYDGQKISCKHDACNCAIMSDAADVIERYEKALNKIADFAGLTHEQCRQIADSTLAELN